MPTGPIDKESLADELITRHGPQLKRFAAPCQVRPHLIPEARVLTGRCVIAQHEILSVAKKQGMLRTGPPSRRCPGKKSHRVAVGVVVIVFVSVHNKMSQLKCPAFGIDARRGRWTRSQLTQTL